jgi:hypothetical protein
MALELVPVALVEAVWSARKAGEAWVGFQGCFRLPQLN